MTKQVVSTDVSSTLFLSEPMRLAFEKIDANFTEIYAGVVSSIATSRILGRVTAGTGAVESLTGTQATTLLNAFTSTLKGLAPASGGGTTNFLRADGTWTQVSLSANVTGNLPVANLNAGTSASATTFWRGDGTWATPAGGGGGTSFGNSWDWTTTATRITFQFPTIAANYLEVDDDGTDGSLFVGGCEIIEIVANDQLVLSSGATLTSESLGVTTLSADAAGLLGEASLVLDPTDILGAKASLNGKLVELASTDTVTLSASTNTIILDGTTASFNGDINFNNGGNTTVGAPGAGSALPITPEGYIFIRVGMGLFQIPYYARA